VIVPWWEGARVGDENSIRASRYVDWSLLEKGLRRQRRLEKLLPLASVHHSLFSDYLENVAFGTMKTELSLEDRAQFILNDVLMNHLPRLKEEAGMEGSKP